MLTIIEDKPKLVLGAEKWQAAPFRFLDNLQVFSDGPSWQDIVLSGNTALTLTNALANGLNYVKLFGGTEQRNLPSEYTQVAYLQSDGTQYINTFLTNQGTGTFTAGADVVPSPDTPMDIVCNNGVVKFNRNLYSTQYHDEHLSQTNGVTVGPNNGVNVSGKVDCRTIKSFKITTTSPQGSFRIFKYGTDNTYIDANSTGNIGDIVTFGDNVGFFRIQYNYTSGSVGTENILIYNSAHNLGIYTDGTTETVEITGKNLYNPATMMANKYINASGEEVSSTSGDSPLSHTGFIKVQAGMYYTISVSNRIGNAPNTGAFNWFSSKDLSTILATRNTYYIASNVSSYTASFQALVGAEYLIINFVNGTNVQIEQGSTATTYEPYFNGGSATAENLFKVGTYQDVQSVIDGGVTRKVGIKVLDGTETWTYDSQYSRFSLDENIGVVNTTIPRSIPAFCTHYGIDSSQTPIGNLPDNTGYIGSISGGGQYSKFWVHTSAYNDATNYKAFLASEYQAGHPVILVYPLATPTTETVTAQPLTTQAGTNIVEITQASIDNLELEVSYKATI